MGISTIGGRYAAYKRGTNRVVNWIVPQAAACGSGDPKASYTKGVKVGTLQKCAEAIATRKPFTIPGYIINLLEDVITGREVCAEWYSKKGKRDDGHEHFIDVLYHIHGVLKEARDKSTKEKVASGLKQRPVKVIVEDEAEAVANLFETLDVEDPIEEPLGTIPTPKETKEPVELELQVAPYEEKKFRLWCMFEDLHEIREWIKDIWMEYRDGKISYFVASTCVEDAFRAMERAELEAAIATADGYSAVLKLLGLRIRAESSEDGCTDC